MTNAPQPKPFRTIYFKDDPPYWQALGRFIEKFAEVEEVMFSTLTWYAKIPDTAAKVLLSGTRIEAAIQYINRIIEIDPPSDDRAKELENVFQQLKAINNVRNKIVHYGTFLTDDGRYTTNMSRALTPKHANEWRASKEELEAMNLDLQKIINHLVMQKFMPDASLEERSRHMGLLTDAWLYKPETPKPHPKAGKDRKAAKHRE